jgi:hypothetical protein
VVEPQDTQGRRLYELGDGQWNIPALRTVLEDIIPKHRTVEAYEVEHEFPTIGRRVMLLNARRVFDKDGSTAALLLAIEDVTRRREAEREKDELLRQKEVAGGDAAPRRQQSSNHSKHPSTQGPDRAIRGDTPAPTRRSPAGHVGGDGAAATAGLRIEREYRDRALSMQALRQLGEVDGRGPSASLDQGASDLGQSGLRGSCQSWTVCDGARDQRLEACLPERRGGRNPSQLRRAAFWLAPLRFRQRIRVKASDQRRLVRKRSSERSLPFPGGPQRLHVMHRSGAHYDSRSV